MYTQQNKVSCNNKALHTVTGLRLRLACLYLGNASDCAAVQRLARGLARQAQWPTLQLGAHIADPLFPPGLCHRCGAAVGQILLQAAGRHVHHHTDNGQVHCLAAFGQVPLHADFDQVHRHAAAGQVYCLAED